MLKKWRFDDGTISFQVKVFSEASMVIVRRLQLIALTLSIKLLLLAILHQQHVN
jgi:hypothetical protein